MPLDLTTPTSLYMLLIFGILALIVVYILVALVEGVILTLLVWNPFRVSLTVALVMNLTSGLVNSILLVLLQHTPLVWLPVSFLLSLLIEWLVLSYFKRDAIRRNLLFTVLVNLASYILLILPAYYYGTHT
jgi:hypothetical protein